MSYKGKRSDVAGDGSRRRRLGWARDQRGSTRGFTGSPAVGALSAGEAGKAAGGERRRWGASERKGKRGSGGGFDRG